MSITLNNNLANRKNQLQQTNYRQVALREFKASSLL